MKETGLRNGAHGAEKFGLKNLAAVHWNLPDTILVEHAVAHSEGQLVRGGALGQGDAYDDYVPRGFFCARHC